ncbi:hypothetical protein E2C01_043851 [Portunus trituberculatus]|uniref:Uncharacterized protein n=1 Tax=Portunus trituberculatus TaxID=210409 RepID=A0A5B7FYF2_PORTR|nr:hypothetical protein [Portunus trituberculatus]
MLTTKRNFLSVHCGRGKEAPLALYTKRSPPATQAAAHAPLDFPPTTVSINTELWAHRTQVNFLRLFLEKRCGSSPLAPADGQPCHPPTSSVVLVNAPSGAMSLGLP